MKYLTKELMQNESDTSSYPMHAITLKEQDSKSALQIISHYKISVGRLAPAEVSWSKISDRIKKNTST